MIKERILAKRILVIGDIMLDAYYFGSVNRISPEAPVPIFLKKESRSVAGGAANVAANLISAGQNVSVASVVGNDFGGRQVIEKLKHLGCDTSAIVMSKERKTTIKTRLLAENNQQILRIDDEQTDCIKDSDAERLLCLLEEKIKAADAVILSDYLKGVLTQEVCGRAIELANIHHIPAFVDPKGTNVEKYTGAFVIKPNMKELKTLTGENVCSKDELASAAGSLRTMTSCGYVVVTMGAKGMGVFGGRENRFINCKAREVFDVSGAGDTVISYLAACYVNHFDIEESAQIANIAAGIKVGKVGTATVSVQEIEHWIMQEQRSNRIGVGHSKWIKLNDLLELMKQRRLGRVVFTNGCFDILHAGHVEYLSKASRCGDILIVGVNSDESVRRLKGETRPVNTLKDRIAVLAGLESVNYIVSFHEDTPEEMIRQIQPDVLVKGADYQGKEIAGADYVKAHGGEVKLIPLVENCSTTNIIKKVGRFSHG